jgi:hypothetical protein
VIVAHVLPGALRADAVRDRAFDRMDGRGLVIVESLFGYPGIGRMLVFAIRNRDVPLLQAISLVVAAVYALANLGRRRGAAGARSARGVVGMTGPRRKLQAEQVALAKPEGRRGAGKSVVPGRRRRSLSADGAGRGNPSRRTPQPISTPARHSRRPSQAHLFGTDGFGRDVFSRVLVGARRSCCCR